MRAISPERMLDDFLPKEASQGKSRLIGFGALLAIVVGLTIAWRWGPLGDWVHMETLVRWGDAIQSYPLSPLYVIAAFVVAGVAMVPVTLLIAATAVVFSPPTSIAQSMAGALLSAVVLFLIGRKLGRDSVRRFAGDRLNRISQRLSRKGVLTVTALRVLPVAPFSVVNLVMGASQVTLRDFVLGTLLGMAPGIVAISLLGGTVMKVIQNSDWDEILLVGLATILTALGLLGIKLFFKRRAKESGKS